MSEWVYYKSVGVLCQVIWIFWRVLISNELRDYSEKAMAPHSSTLAWRILWMEGPGGLQSMGSLGVGHNWATSLSLFTFMHWRRQWQPTPVFLPGESQGRGSLVGCRLWGSHRVRHDWSDLAAAAAAKRLLFYSYCYFCNMALDYPYFSIIVNRINFSTSLLISQLIIWFAILSSSP